MRTGTRQILERVQRIALVTAMASVIWVVGSMWFVDWAQTNENDILGFIGQFAYGGGLVTWVVSFLVLAVTTLTRFLSS